MFKARLRKGSVLIVALGVMTVLAVLGFVFLTTTRVERAISRNYVDMVRAKMYAQSGLDYAVGQITRYIQGTGTAPADYSIAEGSNVPWYYAGSTSLGPATALERARLVSFPQLNAGGNPIYVGIQDLTTPDTIPVPNTQHGVSYFFQGTYSQDTNNNPADGETHGDYCSLKVVECGAQIYINGGDDMDSSDPARPLPDNIRMLLNNLSSVLQSNGVTCPHGQSITANLNLGDRIRDIKVVTGPPRSILTKATIKGAAYPYLGEHDYEIVSGYITTNAWLDKTTLHPGTLQHVGNIYPNRLHDPTLQYLAAPNGAYAMLQQRGEDIPDFASAKIGGLLGTVDVCNIVSSMREIVFASCNSDRLVSDEHSNSCYHWHHNDHWSTFPIGAEQTAPPPGNLQMNVIQRRAPINVNSAHRHVLEACFRGLQGVYLDRTPWVDPFTGAVMSSGTAQATWQTAPQWEGNGYTSNQLVTIPNNLAAWLADRFNEARTVPVGHIFYPYRLISHWKQFDDFIDLLATQAGWTSTTPNQKYREVQKRIVKANANPNSRINKWNPDQCLMPSNTRWSDTDKADLRCDPSGYPTGWTTEFSFRSGGYFEIESLGRVLGPFPAPGGLRQIVAEQKVCVLAKVYNVIKHNTQRDFVHNMIGAGATSLITTYPENVADNNGAGDLAPTYANPTYRYYGGLAGSGPQINNPHYCASAEFDGYIMPATTDKYSGAGGSAFFRDFTSTFGQWAQGTVEEGRSIIAPEGNPSRGSQSELFPDGVFIHQTRRYPNYQSTASQSKCYGGAVGNNNNIDEFLRYAPVNNVLNFLGPGTIEFWFKPTWTFDDMPQNTFGNICGSDGGPFYQSWTHLHPTGEAGHVFVSAGMAFEDGQGHSAGNQRLAIFARQTAGTEKCSSEATRRHVGATRGNISGIWTGGGAPYNGKAFWNDICPIWGWCYYIAYFIPSDAFLPLSAGLSNPRSWKHPGKWHHIVLLYSGAMSYILVDGDTSGPTKGSISAQTITNLDNNWSLFIGCNRFRTTNTNGHPNNADGTIDGLKIYNSMFYSTGGFNPPNRYSGSSVYNSWLIQPSLAAVPGGNPGGTVANASWTVWFPANQMQQSSVVVTLTTSGTAGTLTSAVMGSNGCVAGHASCGTGAQVDADGIPGTPIQSFSLAAGSTLSYRIEFNQSGWITSAPILDDFSVAIALSAPKYYYYYFSN